MSFIIREGLLSAVYKQIVSSGSSLADKIVYDVVSGRYGLDLETIVDRAVEDYIVSRTNPVLRLMWQFLPLPINLETSIPELVDEYILIKLSREYNLFEGLCRLGDVDPNVYHHMRNLDHFALSKVFTRIPIKSRCSDGSVWIGNLYENKGICLDYSPFADVWGAVARAIITMTGIPYEDANFYLYGWGRSEYKNRQDRTWKNVKDTIKGIWRIYYPEKDYSSDLKG